MSLPKTTTSQKRIRTELAEGIESARGDMDRVEEEIFFVSTTQLAASGFEGRQLLFDLHF